MGICACYKNLICYEQVLNFQGGAKGSLVFIFFPGMSYDLKGADVLFNMTCIGKEIHVEKKKIFMYQLLPEVSKVKIYIYS